MKKTRKEFRNEETNPEEERRRKRYGVRVRYDVSENSEVKKG